MLLGKRPRLPIKRTTSMTGISVDLGDLESENHQNFDLHMMTVLSREEEEANNVQSVMSRNYSALVSPRIARNHGRDHLLQPPLDHFLRTCGLCKRRLAPGRDIYMYRGDTAFCSSECREKQIKEDERKEDQCATSTVGSNSKKKDDRHASTCSRRSRKNQTVAAA